MPDVVQTNPSSYRPVPRSACRGTSRVCVVCFHLCAYVRVRMYICGCGYVGWCYVACTIYVSGQFVKFQISHSLIHL